MTTPTFTLPTSGSDPRTATKEGLEENINQIIIYLDEARISGDAALMSGLEFQGGWDASVGTYPSADKDGEAISTGDFFWVSVEGNFGGTTYAINEPLVALVDNPSTTEETDWFHSSINPSLVPVIDRLDKIEGTTNLVFDTVEDFFSNTVIDELTLTDGDTVSVRKGEMSWTYNQTTTSPHIVVNGAKYYVNPSYGPTLPEYNLLAFGAKVDGVTDDYAAFTACCDAVQDSGGGSVVWSGTCFTTQQIDASAWTKNIAFIGRGERGALKTSTDDISLIFGAVSTPFDLRFDNVEFRGAWEDNNQQSGSDRWLFHIDGAMGDVTVTYTSFVSSQKGGLKLGACSSFSMLGGKVEECARGGVNVSGSSRSNISKVFFHHLGDDAVSLHTVTAQGVQPEQHIVTNNHLVDTQGIAILGGRNVNVVNNTGERIRGRFFITGYDGSFNEGAATATSINFTGNIVHDCLDANAILGSGSLNSVLQFATNAADAGSLNGIPGTRDTVNGGIVPLYGNLTDVDGVSVGAVSINVSGNFILRTLEAVANYSDWGRGLMFSEDGYVDPAVSETNLRSRIVLGAPMRNLSFTHNEVRGISSIRFFRANDGGYTNVLFESNNISDCSDHIFDTGGSSTDRKFDVTFRGNTLDGDPFYLDAGRSDDGTWAADDNRRCFNLPNSQGWMVDGNHIKNVSQVENTSGSARLYGASMNWMYGQLISTSFSTSNAGVGQPGVCYQRTGYGLIDQVVDTTLTTFGNYTNNNYAAGAQPTSGFYHRGMIILNASTSTNPSATQIAAYIPNDNGKLLLGWIRKTTGNGHDEGVDWEAVFVDSVA